MRRAFGRACEAYPETMDLALEAKPGSYDSCVPNQVVNLLVKSDRYTTTLIPSVAAGLINI